MSSCESQHVVKEKTAVKAHRSSSTPPRTWFLDRNIVCFFFLVASFFDIPHTHTRYEQRTKAENTARSISYLLIWSHHNITMKKTYKYSIFLVYVQHNIYIFVSWVYIQECVACAGWITRPHCEHATGAVSNQSGGTKSTGNTSHYKEAKVCRCSAAVTVAPWCLLHAEVELTLGITCLD